MKFTVYSGGQRITDKVWVHQLHSEEAGIFESLRTYEGCIFREHDHLDRLEETARAVGFTLKHSRQMLCRELDMALTDYAKSQPEGADLFCRLTLWRDRVFVLVGTRRHSEEIFRNGVVLQTTCVRRSLTHAADPQAKTNAYQNAVLAGLQPTPGAYEYLFLDAEGFAAEVSIGNLFIVKKGRLLTPPVRGILNGVTRRFVIECALSAGIEVLETLFTRHEIYNADEAFLTNTSWEILPVRELDRRTVGLDIPGPLTHQVHRIFKQKVKAECRKAK